MRTISHPLFIVLAMIYIAYYALKQTDITFPLWISNYLADLLSIFLVNTVALWLIRKIKVKPNLEFSQHLVLLSIVMFSVFFEFYLPLKSTIYVYDAYDIVCYFISGVGFVIWRKELCKDKCLGKSLNKKS